MRYFLVLFFIALQGFGQQTQYVDFKKIDATIKVFKEFKQVEGIITVDFLVLKDIDSIYLDAVNMEVLKGVLSTDVEIKSTENKNWLIHSKGFKKGQLYKVDYKYTATPKQALYFTGNQIWTQGQGKYTSHWLPSIDDTNDKIEFDLSITYDKDYQVITNGKLINKKENEKTITWSYDMQKPMSSYLVAFAIGDYTNKALTSTSGVPIELYYKPEDSLKAESTYRYTKEIFDFFKTEIGVPYPWQNYKQVPVRDFLYAGMENTSCTIFSEAFVVDHIGFNDRNYVNVNAHELAHQWFGNLVTAISGEHHWLQEGFATYYALLAEKEIFGDDYYYWKLYNSAEQLKALSEEGKGQSLLDPKASSLTFYEKGAWALHILNELIGETAFKEAIKNYLKKHQFKNVSTQDLLTEIKEVSKIDITSWEKDWLQQTAFKAEEAYRSLIKSSFIKDYFKITALRITPLSEKKEILLNALKNGNDFIGQEVIYQLAVENISAALPIYKEGLQTNNLYVRQAISLVLNRVPEELKPVYEQLLTDKSYVTIEEALFNLWKNFPKDRAAYLDATKGIVGFQDKNIKQLWLTLALVTEGYMTSAKPIFKKELQDYTSKEFSFEIRQKAFEYINEINLYNEDVIKNLVNSCVHHNWRFRSFSRELLTKALEDSKTKKGLITNLELFSEKERMYLKTVLE